MHFPFLILQNAELNHICHLLHFSCVHYVKVTVQLCALCEGYCLAVYTV